MITLRCPNLACRAVLQVPNEVRGKHVRCGSCNECFVVPQIPTPEKRKPPADKAVAPKP